MADGTETDGTEENPAPRNRYLAALDAFVTAVVNGLGGA